MEPKKRNRYTTESYIQLVKAKNPHNLDYSKVVYVDQGVKVQIKCNDCGYEFASRPLDVLHRGTGCKRCHNKRIATFGYSKIQTWEIILKKIREVHGDEYDYDPSSYISYKKKIAITCKLHGVFCQTVDNHISGQKCPECSRMSAGQKRSLPVEIFLTKSTEIHSNKFTYDVTEYENLNSKVKILCPEHGTFLQVAQTHMAGHGCPTCAKVYSTPQKEINEFINSLGISTIENYKMQNGKHLDIVCKSHNIAIEFNGLIWHSEQFQKNPNYHREKTDQASQEGLRLIHIFEDEWLTQQNKVKRFLATAFGKNETKWDARKLLLDNECNWAEVKQFLNTNHMQGACAPPLVSYGLRDPQTNKLVAAMTFSTRDVQEGAIELSRFCSDGIVRGGFSKLLKHAILQLLPKQIISFSANRLVRGDIYLKSGFRCIGEVPPRYWYVKNRQRFDRRFFQKQYLKTEFANYDENKTEKENCEANGYYRIWDSGKKKWVLDL